MLLLVVVGSLAHAQIHMPSITMAFAALLFVAMVYRAGYSHKIILSLSSVLIYLPVSVKIMSVLLKKGI